MMLILSVIVIAFSVFVGIYLPQMKETSEMMHSEDVKSAILKFSSDMDSVYSRGQAGTYSEVFSLGGGDILLSSSKSAGTVEIGDEEFAEIRIPYTKKTVIQSSGTTNETPEDGVIPLTTVKVSYTPVLPYWEEQGYWYEKGVVWVQKGDVSIPVSSALRSVGEGDEQMKQTAASWLQMMNPRYLTENKSVTVTTDSSGNVTKEEKTQYIYTMTLVNVSADGHSFLSGSGNAKLKISAELPSQITEYELSSDMEVKYKLSGNTEDDSDDESITLMHGTLPSLLRVTKIDVKVSVE